MRFDLKNAFRYICSTVGVLTTNAIQFLVFVCPLRYGDTTILFPISISTRIGMDQYSTALSQPIPNVPGSPALVASLSLPPRSGGKTCGGSSLPSGTIRPMKGNLALRWIPFLRLLGYHHLSGYGLPGRIRLQRIATRNSVITPKPTGCTSERIPAW